MTPLWIALLLTALPALWLLLSPLWRARALHDAQRRFDESDDANRQNVAVFRRRLASLENAFERGDIDRARFDEDKLELERSLLDDTTAAPVKPLKSPAAGRVLVPVVAVLVLAAAVGGYHYGGAQGDLALYALERNLQNDPEVSLERYVERLEQEAERQPGNPNVWGRLFTAYRESGAFEQADQALERLMALEGRTPSLLGELAELRFFMADRRLIPPVQTLIDEALEKDPRQPKALSLLGVVAFDQGDYALAIDRWRRALASLGDGTTAEALREGIRQAQARMGADDANVSTDAVVE
ncbi:c-type cytochrome biogenesis protein CcmI [Halomonas sp. HNIBRBA4712]|uniref:c-type cytochrome biogenesis protein CcmI n=1 Tax=Halomonas sp. HNIBRBA4712 TaxID=3373087 RepID=UPI00374673F6